MIPPELANAGCRVSDLDCVSSVGHYESERVDRQGVLEKRERVQVLGKRGAKVIGRRDSTINAKRRRSMELLICGIVVISLGIQISCCGHLASQLYCTNLCQLLQPRVRQVGRSLKYSP